MFKAIMRTPNDFAILFVRLGLGASLLAHGLDKLGIFGDMPEGLYKVIEANAKTSAEKLANIVGVDPWMGYLALAAEVLGAAALILGFFGRFCALCIGGLMVVAAWKAGGLEAEQYLRWWRDAVGDTTYGSYHILAVCAALAILIRGSGALSIDWFVSPKGRHGPE